jgi:molybdopterin biosynthesis enzyme MoaB
MSARIEATVITVSDEVANNADDDRGGTLAV